jgi:hypothetical protein
MIALWSIILFATVASPMMVGAAQQAYTPPKIVAVSGVSENATLKGTVSIEAIVEGSRLNRVIFDLRGDKDYQSVDRKAPYFFLGDTADGAVNWDTTTFPDGRYRLQVIVLNRNEQKDERFFNFTIANGTAPQPTAQPTSVPTAQPTSVPTAQPTNVPTAQPTTQPGNQTSVAGQKCPDWVHDQHMTTGPDGKQYRTWHPPTDPQYKCWFGHEHGSDPRNFPGFSQVGMPAFGYTGLQAGDNEPHVGFKVFVVNDRDRGLWWMASFHQGTSGAARAFVRFHSLDLAVARADGTLLANVRVMADTGNSYRKCDIHGPAIPNSGPEGQGGARKAIPTSDCATDVYESWSTYGRVGNLFESFLTFDIDNGATVLVRQSDGTYSNTQVMYTASLICPGIEPTKQGNDCDRFGDKRSIINPRMNFANTTGNGEIWTDAYGNIVPAGQGIRQFVSPGYQAQVRPNTNFANGLDGNVQVYVAMQYCSDSNDCNPDNYNDGSVTLPN